MSTWRTTVEQLVSERGPALFGYAYVLTGDRHAADDLVQDAIVRTFARGRGGYSMDQAHTYVKRAIFTSFVDGRRRAKRRPQISDAELEMSQPDSTSGVAAAVSVHQAILTLPPRERAVVVLRFLDDMPVAGVARELNLAEGSVKRYLSDAIARLRRTHPHLADFDDALTGGTQRVPVTHKETRS